MSETGNGGRGLEGNLKMAQRLFDDIRNLRPEAWFDWQYMEERSDQWCVISGSFQRQFYRKVKNYYVRQQCSRFIKRGYDILTADCPQTLAAVSPSRDTLTLVLLNEGDETEHRIDLSGNGKLKIKDEKLLAFRTSANEDMASTTEGITLHGSTLNAVLPKQSITTIVIPIKCI